MEKFLKDPKTPYVIGGFIIVTTMLLFIPQPYTRYDKDGNKIKGRTNGFNYLFKKGKDITY